VKLYNDFGAPTKTPLRHINSKSNRRNRFRLGLWLGVYQTLEIDLINCCAVSR